MTTTLQTLSVAQGPIAQTVKQVQAAFDALLDISALQQQIEGKGASSAMADMLESAAHDLVALGACPE